MTTMLWRYSTLLLLWLLPSISSLQWLGAAAVAPPPTGFEPQQCGKLSIPYPFALRGGRRLPLTGGLEVACGGGDGGGEGEGTPTVLLGNRSYEVVQIWLNDARVVIKSGPVAWRCEPEGVLERGSGWIDLSGTPYSFTPENNRLRLVGCGAFTRMWNHEDGGGMSWCRSLCDSPASGGGGACAQISSDGCCEDHVTQLGMKRFDFDMGRAAGGTARGCSKAFLTSEDVPFTMADLDSGWNIATNYSVSLDWWVGDRTCKEARKDGRTYACKEHSSCFDSPNGDGYYCQCNEGYAGNPYLPAGGGNGSNVLGNGCTKADSSPSLSGAPVKVGGFLAMVIALGSSLLFLALIFALWLHWALRKRRHIRLKQKLFLRNGGLLLEHISTKEGVDARTMIFTIEELEKATENFSESRILGQGGYGTVYMGILPNEKAVAIKKSRLSDESQIEQFINEVFILSQVIHRNVVRLLGCCLETEVPLLVYECVPNGTLYRHIHCIRGTSKLSWETRLRIATETAEALAYLHSATCIPIIHRDVKSTNILLDENYTAKVSDFGASKSVPFEMTHVTTLIQGTLGYLDPEYLHTSQLTDKSDVYSFGVVLVELLLSEKPILLNRSGMERNLAAHFVLSLESKCLEQILDAQILEEAAIEHLYQVAELARRCLSGKGEDRPTMKEVAMELEELRKPQSRVHSKEKIMEFDCSLTNLARACVADHDASRQYSLEDDVLLSFEVPR